MMTGQWSNRKLKLGNGKCIKFEITGMDMKVSFTVKSITCLSYNLFPEWLPPCNPEDPLCHVQPGVHPHLHLTVSGFHWVSESHRNEISDHRVFWHLFPDPRCKISFLNRVPHNPKKTKKQHSWWCACLGQGGVFGRSYSDRQWAVIGTMVGLKAHSFSGKVKFELKETIKQQNIKR